MTAAWILHEEIGAPKFGCLIWALIFMQKESNSSFSFVMVEKEHWTWASFEGKIPSIIKRDFIYYWAIVHNYLKN
jgi:hypothetical protein